MDAGYLRDLDWTAVGSLATAAAVIVAFYQIWVERSARKRGERQAQAQRVSGWLRPTGHVVEAADDRPPTTEAVLLNASTEPVYRALVWLVLMQGAGPATGEKAAKAEGEQPATVSILPPGRFVAALPEWTGGGMYARPAVEIAFTDAAGRHWIRRTTGKLESISSEPVRHYGLSEPVDWTEPEELH